MKAQSRKPALIWLCAACVSLAAEPSGPSLKSLVDTTQIGIRLEFGNAGADGYAAGNSAAYRGAFEREFNSGTITSYPAWSAWMPGPNVFDIDRTNQGINYLETIGATQMIHLLLAPDQYFPAWFTNGAFTNEELDTMLKNWVETLITSNGNQTKVEVWNLTNEVLSYDRTEYQSLTKNKWLQLGFEPDQSGLAGAAAPNAEHPVLFRKVFDYARQHTDAKLELRENNSTFKGTPKNIALYQLARHLAKSGAPIDAVGLQGHQSLDTPYDWTLFREHANDFRKLGLEVYLTEIDIGDDAESWTEQKAQEQGRIYYNMIRAAMEAGLEYIHFWGLRDGDDTSWRTAESPLLFAADYAAKPAYHGVQSALIAANRLKVKAKGAGGGEMMELLVDGQVAAVWWLTPDWSDYSYPWFAHAADIKLRLTGSIERGSSDQPIQIEKISTYGTARQPSGGPYFGGETVSIGIIDPGVPLPPAITGLATASGIKQVVLSWNPSGEPTVSGYNVYRSKTADGVYQRLNDAPLVAPGFVDTRLPSEGVSVHYYVTAIGPTGHESPAAKATGASAVSHVAYQNAPRAIPGRIEAEDYDEGGNGSAYHDSGAGNNGNAYRSDDVDISNGASNFNLGWVNAGEWLEFTVEATPGAYSLSARTASPQSNRRIRFLLDNEELGTLTTPNTNGYSAYQTSSLPYVVVPSGPQSRSLRIEFLDGGYNIDWFEFSTPLEDPPSIELTEPAADRVFRKPSSILLRTAASETVKSVRFFAGSAQIGESSTAPFAFEWKNPPHGTFQITAVATSQSGIEHRSAARSIEIRHSDGYTFDDWRRQHFVPGQDDLPSGDPDQDNRTNEFEYIFATEPLRADSQNAAITTYIDEGQLALRYSRRRLESVADISWSYLASNDLTHWATLQLGIDFLEETSESIRAEAETVVARVTLNPLPRFVRVAASRD